MKKLSVLFFAMFTAFVMQAQITAAPIPAAPSTATTTVKNTVKKVQTQNAAAYACPKCFMISKGVGQCSMCKMDKVQLGTYYCPKCMKGTGDKAGTCSSCNGATVQMTRKLCAKNGGTPLRTGKEKAAEAAKSVDSKS